ncbi:hypothetical protein KIMH_10070 [Bombiscardovia apis]|uniref:Glycosyltransferase n=1 Tax=Bombiscardovia apis TaxID=2932182 RepID=A0ABM8BDB1_9BIFI|nr:hypothetical protein [Bombiscardovia apis]BDR54896.1 hypothetical protein KIMH_10070 [Bombiscardovia apis]
MIILTIECAVFNLPHWRSLASANANASANSTSASQSQIALGKGLVRLKDGALLVSDPTQAYIEAPGAQSLNYVQVVPAQTADGGRLKLTADENKHAVWKVHIRLDVQPKSSQQWEPAGSSMVNPTVPGSLYVKNRSQIDQAQRVRLWISEEYKAVVALDSLEVNPRIPFSFNLARVVLMALFAALIIALSPRSKLWRVRLNTGSRTQRWALWVPLLAMVLWCASTVATQVNGFTVRTYHDPGAYTYDFNQYGHLADAFISGQSWLNLPVPDHLSSINPYDVYARERLLATGEEPIFWDHVFYEGHWYSYFGPLPALLIFAPYRLVTSLFVPGGLMLPTPAACALLIAGFTIFSSLLVVRLIRRFLPEASLAATIMALLTFTAGSQVVYLWFRNNFYTVPFDASLLLVSLGLWFWLGARRVRIANSKTSRAWTASDLDHQHHSAYANAQVYLSLPRLAAGAVAISATLGCRQTFILSGLLAFPIFADEFKAMWAGVRPARRKAASQQIRPAFSRSRSAAILTTALLPVMAVIAPLLAYNAWRFGSAFNFGNTYQITVVDLNTYKPPMRNLAWLVVYYLALPLTPTSSFPYLQRSPAPLSVWQYTEPGLGGLFVLAPIVALALLLLLLPAVRRKLKAAQSLPLIASMLLLAIGLMLFTAYIAGYDARYMLDFSWLLALVAALPIAASTGSSFQPSSKGVYIIRTVLLLCLLATVVLACAAGLVELKSNPLFAQVQAWFTAL